MPDDDFICIVYMPMTVKNVFIKSSTDLYENFDFLFFDFVNCLIRPLVMTS